MITLIPIPIPATSIEYKNFRRKEKLPSDRKNNPNMNRNEIGSQCLPVADINIWNRLVLNKNAASKAMWLFRKIFLTVLYSNTIDSTPKITLKRRAIIKNWDKSLVT